PHCRGPNTAWIPSAGNRAALQGLPMATAAESHSGGSSSTGRPDLPSPEPELHQGHQAVGRLVKNGAAVDPEPARQRREGNPHLCGATRCLFSDRFRLAAGHTWEMATAISSSSVTVVRYDPRMAQGTKELTCCPR